jgi:hypothetical protein
MAMTTAWELFDRLQAQTGPSRILDIRLYRFFVAPAGTTLAEARAQAPRYTASLDAALPFELVTSAAWIAGRWHATQYGEEGGRHTCVGATEVLARRAVAVRARIADDEERLRAARAVAVATEHVAPRDGRPLFRLVPAPRGRIEYARRKRRKQDHGKG